MGRSISTAPGAVEVLYFAFSDEDELRNDWVRLLREDGDTETTADEVSQGLIDEALENELLDLEGSIHAALERYPSFYEEDDWSGREGHVIAANSMTDIIISTYGGLASVSIAPNSARRPDDYYDNEIALREGWTRRMAPHLAKAIREATHLEEYVHAGTFSNGESVYGKVAA